MLLPPDQTGTEVEMEDRRRYERVRLPEAAQAYVLAADGSRLGLVRVLGAGGLFVETNLRFAEFTPHKIYLVDEEANIRRKLTVITRHSGSDGVGFEFLSLDLSVAVEIGIIIGRYLPGAQAVSA